MRASETWVGSTRSTGSRSTIRVHAVRGDGWAGEIDVVAGTWEITDDGTLNGQSLRLDVPNTPEWRPIDPLDPLAPYGQELIVELGSEAGSRLQAAPAGVFRIMSSTPMEDVLQVEAKGRGVNIERARFTRPVTIPSATKRADALTRIIGHVIPHRIEGASLTAALNRAVTWEDDRLEAVGDLLSGWHARGHVDDFGVLIISPQWPSVAPDADPDVEFLDGATGTLIALESPPFGPRGEGYNAAIVSTVPEGDEAPVTEAWALTTGPMAWGGPYGYHPRFYSSPMLKPDRAELKSLAEALVRDSLTGTQVFRFRAAPDWRVQVGDVARVRSARQGVDLLGRITALTHTRTEVSGELSHEGTVRA